MDVEAGIPGLVLSVGWGGGWGGLTRLSPPQTNMFLFVKCL